MYLWFHVFSDSTAGSWHGSSLVHNEHSLGGSIAVKTVEFATTDAKSKFIKEVEVLTKLHFPYIVFCAGACVRISAFILSMWMGDMNGTVSGVLLLYLD